MYKARKSVFDECLEPVEEAELKQLRVKVENNFEIYLMKYTNRSGSQEQLVEQIARQIRNTLWNDQSEPSRANARKLREQIVFSGMIRVQDDTCIAVDVLKRNGIFEWLGIEWVGNAGGERVGRAPCSVYRYVVQLRR